MLACPSRRLQSSSFWGLLLATDRDLSRISSTRVYSSVCKSEICDGAVAVHAPSLPSPCDTCQAFGKLGTFPSLSNCAHSKPPMGNALDREDLRCCGLIGLLREGSTPCTGVGGWAGDMHMQAGWHFTSSISLALPRPDAPLPPASDGPATSSMGTATCSAWLRRLR